MTIVRLIAAALVGTGALSIAADAFAQKSADTVRIAMNFPTRRLSGYYQPEPEAGMFYRLMEEPLIRYDEGDGKFLPTLATQWRRIDDRIIEFQLRDGVKFHNGNSFDADHVVHIFN